MKEILILEEYGIAQVNMIKSLRRAGYKTATVRVGYMSKITGAETDAVLVHTSYTLADDSSGNYKLQHLNPSLKFSEPVVHHGSEVKQGLASEVDLVEMLIGDRGVA